MTPPDIYRRLYVRCEEGAHATPAQETAGASTVHCGGGDPLPFF